METQLKVDQTPEIMAQNPETQAAYVALMTALEWIPGLDVQAKKTSVHIAAGGAAFLGVHPRRSGVRINLVLARRLEHPRIVNSEQVSKNRFHNELDLGAGNPIDTDLADWIREEHALQSG